MKPRSSLWSFWMGCAAAVILLAAPSRGGCQDWEGKIQRGFANMVGGVVEIPGCVSDVNRKHGALKGYTLGFFKGVAMVPVRTLVGVYEFLTFYVPMPANYDPVLTPPTAFNYWDEE